MKSRPDIKFIIAVLLLVLIFFGNAEWVIANDFSTSGRGGMVATAHPLATEAGLEMLKLGGNAIDAAVAAAFTIGVVEPDGSGIGGGGAMVVYLNDRKESIFINYYQQASEKVNQINFTSASDRHSMKSVLIPGTVAGLATALEYYGTLPLKTVLEPAIRHARDGFEIDATLGGIMLDNNELVTLDSATTSVYTFEGFPLMQGDLLYQESLAHTLDMIAENGPSWFYEGPFARKLVKCVEVGGGVMTLDDLKNYKTDIGKPVSGTYRGYEILSAGAPLSGITVIEALNILENVNFYKTGHYKTSGNTLHIMAETFKRAYADRFYFIEDPRYGNVPVTGLTSKNFANERYGDINRFKAVPARYRNTQPGNPFKFNQEKAPSQAAPGHQQEKDEGWERSVDEEKSSYDEWGEDLFDSWGSRKKTTPEKRVKKQKIQQDTNKYDNDDYDEFDGHTTHLSVIDKDGNAVSLTQTLGTFFGSGMTVDGVLLNCSMTNFASTSAVNRAEPGKRPRSAISPTIVLKDDKPYLIVGSPGANRIIATLVQLIVNGIDFDMSIQDMNDSPRFYCQKFDDFLHIEGGISDEAVQIVKKRGHNVQQYGELDLFFGGAQIVLWNHQKDMFYGSADKRRGGVAKGF